MTDQEKKDKRFGTMLTTLIHVVVISLFFFLVAWREPDPPIPEYGIELNLGFVDQGGGDQENEVETQSENSEENIPPVAEVDTDNNELDETEPTEEEVVEEVEKTEETITETNPTENKEEQEQLPPPVEEEAEQATETQEESTVTVKEEEKEVVEKEKDEGKEDTPPPIEKKEEVKPKPKPVVDSRALMGGKKSDTNNKDQASNNQGTYPAKKGNEGDPEGKKNTKGTSPGGEDIGVSYSLDGWKWERPPAKKDDSQIDGVIKFAIDVDDRGRVLSATVIPGTTISDNTIVNFYKKQVLELSFIQLDRSKTPASISKGEVTFVIKTN